MVRDNDEVEVQESESKQLFGTSVCKPFSATSAREVNGDLGRLEGWAL